MPGCERIFTDKASGAKVDRPGLTQALAYVRDGDALVVWKFEASSGVLSPSAECGRRWVYKKV